MFHSRYGSPFFVVGILFLLTGVNGMEKKSETNTSRLRHRINRQDENNGPHKYLHKRQIGSQLPPFTQAQDFPLPFISDQPNSNGPIRQFPGQATFDEEERFFLLRNQQETTLNPLAFINPPRTTPSPVEQQVIDEQRRFQEEIANKGLREQQRRTTTQPTTTTTTTTPPNSLDQFSFQQDPFSNTNLETDFEPSTENFFLSQVNSPQSHSYSFSRLFRSVDRKSRSIDRQHLSVNLLPSTPASQPNFRTKYLAPTTPRTDFGSIGNWLLSHFQQIQQNIANLAEPTFSPFTPRPVKSSYSSTPTYSRSTHTTRPFSHIQSSAQSTTPQQWHGPAYYSSEAPTTPAPLQFDYTEIGAREAAQPWNLPTRFQVPTRFQLPSHLPVITQTRAKNGESSYDLKQVHSIISSPNAVNYKLEPVMYEVQSQVPTMNPNLPRVYPSHVVTATNAPFVYNTKADSSPRAVNVQILTSSTESTHLQSPADEAATYQAYGQIFAADHQKTRPIDATALQPTTQQSVENATSIMSLFKSKLNEYKLYHSAAEQMPVEGQQLQQQQQHQQKSNFQQQNQFLDQLRQQQPSGASLDESALDHVNSAPGSGHNDGKTAIFIRVPAEQPSSTMGYLFDQPISAKTLQKKENYPSGHKKNYRSAQVIKSSLVYRTPPGKRASVSRQELAENSQVDAGAVSNFLEVGKPIRWLFGNTATVAPTSTSRPFVNALLNFIQK